MRPSEKEALVRSMGAFVAREVRAATAPLLDRIKELEARPIPKDGTGIVKAFKRDDGILILTLSDGQAVETGIRDGKDGETPAAAVIEKMIADAVGVIPKPKDGEDAKPEQIVEAVKESLDERVPALREEIRIIVGDAVSAAVKEIKIPEGAKGPDPDEIASAVSAEVERQVKALPPALPGKDGASLDPEVIARQIEVAVQAAVERLPRAKDGVGVAGAVIDRAGCLTLTLTDGSTRDLGKIVGKDGDPGQPGLGFDDIDVVHDGERGFVIRMIRGEQVKEFTFSVPIVLDRGVWKDGEFKQGDGVTWEGSFWIARVDTKTKPGTSDDWRLAIKRGRDGKSVALADVKPMIDKAVDLAVKGIKAQKPEGA